MTQKAFTFFEAANPNLMPAAIDSQFRNTVEEFNELMNTVSLSLNPYAQSLLDNIRYYTLRLAETKESLGVVVHDRIKCLDGICDVGVASEGLAHALNMDYEGAREAVDDSNLSKMIDGQVVRDPETHKIVKPDTYVEPDLAAYI